MLNYDLFKTVVAPEYKDMENATLDVFATEAECEIAESKFGCKYDRAVALITAHLIKMSEISQNGITGQLVKTKVGQLERQYDVANSGDAKDGSYNMTVYGKEFLRIRKQILKSPIFVSC